MKFSILYTTTALAGLSTSSPTPTLVERATSVCGQWDSITTGSYIVYNDIWNPGNANSGSQCVQVNSLSSNVLNWQASWTWVGGTQVKSYPNVVVKNAVKQLSAIGSMKTSFAWTYSGSSLVGNVAYDAFTSSSATGSNEYEIMVWLAALGGAGPISASYGADGKPTPVTTVTLAGQSWKLYKGSNGVNTVFSFLPASGGQIASFSGDFKDFVTYLINNQGLSKSQYLISAGAGSEPTSGNNAVFKVSKYSMVIA